MNNKIKISFVLPENLQKDFKTKMLQDGYDLKGKSKWVAHAVEELLDLKTYADLVKVNDEMKGFEKLESVVIDRELKTKLDESVVEIRRQYPTIEGVQSRILRTAIIQKLL